MEEITAEFEVQSIAPATELRVAPKFQFGCKTDIGRIRDNNEDKYEFYIPEKPNELASRGSAFVVCDGMGGHEAGQIASELALKVFVSVYYGHPSESPETAARAAVAAADRFVTDVGQAVPSRRGLGTTLSALLIVQDKALVVQVGDSRVYRLRHGELEQLEQDHTWVEEAVQAGTFTREQAEAHPYKHMITRAIGAGGSEPDVFEFDLEVGDVFLVCSDGVTNHVPDEDLARLLGEAESPSQLARTVVAEALAGGGSDNATTIVVRIDGLEPVAGEKEA